MNVPRATYRLQLRGGVDFAEAAALVPYLAELGISHLYVSPIASAAPGSTHGYDVTDPGAIDPVLGGEPGLRALCERLAQYGLGLIVDIVPNHMAATPANPWWADVLRWGIASTYARHFDIDWSAPRLLLPVLGEPYGEALASGRLALAAAAADGRLTLTYGALALPLAPPSYARVLAQVPVLADLAPAFAGATAVPAAALERELARRLRAAPVADALARGLARLNRDRSLLHAVHEAQMWRLAYWRLAREALGYRRFFEIADLVGVRVEDEAVFDDVHALVLRFVREGLIAGLRIDHIDGLADPKAYLARLRGASGLDYVVVEKILGAQETLRRDWACAGTTGYEVGHLITALQIDPRGEHALHRAWRRFRGGEIDYRREVAAVKRQLADVNFAGEVDRLARLACAIARRDIATRDFGLHALRTALIELMVALPVYRSYLDAGPPDPADRALLEAALDAALAGRVIEDERVLRFVAALLLEPPPRTAEREELVRRFQQASGPLTAKALEDTVFYRFNRLLALNEVGAEPHAFGLAPAAFHAAMAVRAAHWPHGLSASATHDSKRGEDARARLAVLSEVPELWAAAVARWHARLEALLAASAPAPDRDAEWLLYQALVGACPLAPARIDERMLQTLQARLADYLIKAVREAKQHTSWTAPNPAYEAAVSGMVETLFAPHARALLHDMLDTIGELDRAGCVNTLAQLTLKLTVPGVPDIYQGREDFDFSLVDPDNRRPVDFPGLADTVRRVRGLSPAEVMQAWRRGWPKPWLTQRLLALRAREPALFAHGDYRALTVRGATAADTAPVLAFQRSLHGRAVIVIVPRLVHALLQPDSPAFAATAFAGLHLAPAMPRLRCALTERAVEMRDGELDLTAQLSRFPVAVLVTAPQP